MSGIVYGSPNVSCAIGLAPPKEGDEPLPFFAFFDASIVPGGVYGEEDFAELMVAKIVAAGGTIIYFDNPESAERFHNMASIVFTAACRGDWKDRKEIKETIN